MQTQAMYVNVVTFYVLALPIAYGLVFKAEFKLEGLWYGFAIGLSYQVITYFWLIQRCNWDNISNESMKRRQSEK